MSFDKSMLSPREPIADAKGQITRTWWRKINDLLTNAGTTSSDLVVKPSAILSGATVSAGGTIEAADLPGHSLIGNPLAAAAEPVAVPLDPSLDFAGTALALAPLAAGSLMGNAGTVAAIPGSIGIGSGLTLDPVSKTLSVDGSTANDDILLIAPPDRSGQIAALERKVEELTALVMLSASPSINTGTVAPSGGFLPLVNGDTSPIGIISDVYGVPVYVAV